MREREAKPATDSPVWVRTRSSPIHGNGIRRPSRSSSQRNRVAAPASEFDGPLADPGKAAGRLVRPSLAPEQSSRRPSGRRAPSLGDRRHWPQADKSHWAAANSARPRSPPLAIQSNRRRIAPLADQSPPPAAHIHWGPPSAPEASPVGPHNRRRPYCTRRCCRRPYCSRGWRK